MNIKIFLADDNDGFRQALRSLLTIEHDLTVVGEATNGYDAVTQIIRHCPDIAVLDLVMPVLDGIEVARQIRQKAPTVQVIILTMYATDQHVQRALTAGVRGYLLKEWAGAELVAAIHAVYAGLPFIGTNLY